MLKKILKPLASLRLTVVLIALAMILIYAGTWAQIDAGIWQVQKNYFHSLFTWIDFATLLPRPAPGEWHAPGGFPMLGGYAIGLLLLANLLAAHFLRFKLSWKRAGIILIHSGLILLLVGEGITSRKAVESQMVIDEGQTVSYSQDVRTSELAIIDPSASDHDQVTVIPQSLLKSGQTITHPSLPVEIRVDQFFPNADIRGPMQPGEKNARATAGSGVGITMVGDAEASSIGGAIDVPGAFVTLRAGGQDVGTYMVSSAIDPPPTDRQPLFPPQDFTVGGKRYQIALRFKREYLPYSFTLKEFHFDRYLGTSVPKNFASLVQLIDPQDHVDREIKIWMNHPLRYRGQTFFQADWNQKTEHGTVLQVVGNPAWTLPYLACLIGGLGLVVHFGMKLIDFLRRQAKVRSNQAVAIPANGAGIKRPMRGRDFSPPPIGWLSAGILVPIIITALCAFDVLGHIRGPAQTTPYDLATFGQIPISRDGRVQPLDSVARNSLKVLFERESFYRDGVKTPAIQWLLDLWTKPDVADKDEVIRIDFPELLNFLELERKKPSIFQQITGIGGATAYRFSIGELKPKFAKLEPELRKLRTKDEKQYTLFERRLAELGEKLTLYGQLGSLEGLHIVPPAKAGGDWRTADDADAGAKTFDALPASMQNLVTVLRDYARGNYEDFNRDVASYTNSLDAIASMDTVRFEQFFNRFDPFTNALVLYVIAFLLLATSWLKWSVPLRRSAWCILLLALFVHTFGLGARIYISGRPPVTNLASSALFIAWGAVLLAGGLELIFRDGIGILCASLVGFLSLLIGDRLALTGDTMKVLQAVLDTNFWLATHVIIINLGYAATFLAGFLGIVYVLRGLFTSSLDRDSGKDLSRMIYGIVCFAMTFSFIGTVLGGIWADQSWGRFWGWDPKENGAVLIVLANALLLHARWGGVVRDRGVACLAIFGNIVTSWSWFGTNMLGVGLHSYGFMESALVWLLVFVVGQVLLIAVANVPLAWWRSYRVLNAGAASPRGKIAAVVPA